MPDRDHPIPRRFLIEVRDTLSATSLEARLRRWLKNALRSYGLRVVVYEEVKEEKTDEKT